MSQYIFLLCLLLGFSPFAAAEQVFWAEEGEDATSTHYYFFFSNGDSIQRVRWVWNGGAQNSPTVTEYKFESGGLRVSHMKGSRDDISDLVKGREAKLTLVSQYFLICKSDKEMLIPPKPDVTLSDVQRVDIYNLVSLLAKDRKPLAKTQ